MNPEQQLKEINAEIERKIKTMMNSEGISPGTFAFILGKALILNQAFKKYGLKFIYDKSEKGANLKEKIEFSIADMFLKSKITKGYTAVRLINKIVRLPRIIFRRWILEFDGFKLQMDEGDNCMRHTLENYKTIAKKENVWEVNTTALVKEKVKEGMVCLDIGASIGIFTLQFSRSVGPTGKVYSFEPVEMSFNYMCDNIKLNGYEDRTHPFKMAAWSKSELVRMPLVSDKPIWANGIAVGEFLEELGVTKVDFIKIDVDGPEPEVLEGLIKVFENNPQLQMVIEYYPKYIKDAGCDLEKFMRILNKYFTYKEIPGDYSKGCWNLYCERK